MTRPSARTSMPMAEAGLGGRSLAAAADGTLIADAGAGACVVSVPLGTESALRSALEYAPEVPRSCIVSQKDPTVCIDLAERYACRRIQFYRNVTQEHIQRAHGLGLICNLFWSDDPEDGMEYVRNGIDVVLTNCVHRMIAGGFDLREGKSERIWKRHCVDYPVR